MARKRKSKSKLTGLLSLLLAVIAVLAYGGVKNADGQPEDIGEIKVHFIDVGQGHSTLIQSGDYGVLIDAGEREYGSTVCDYLQKCSVKKLSYVIATHPHSDHIGGMTEVLNTFKCETLYAPQLSDGLIPTTSAYEKFLDAIEDNGIDAHYAVPGQGFEFAGAVFSFAGPVMQLDDLNNMSIVTKLTYGKTSILITGDAEKKEMNTLVSRNFDFKSDIYLMSHHGSSTGLHTEFLKKVSPKVVVISCGKNNDYGHPHRETLSYIKAGKLKAYRTDTQGDVVFTVDKTGYRVKTER